MEAKIDRQRVQEFARKLFGHYTSGILTLPSPRWGRGK